LISFRLSGYPLESVSEEDLLLFKSPLVWGILVAVLIALQVGLSYLSFQSFLRGDWLESILFFLAVPFIGFLMGSGFFWRQQRKRNS
jgi:hypothetical protein